MITNHNGPMKMKRLIALQVLILSAAAAFAQDVRMDKITWATSSALNMRNGKPLENTSTFVTNGVASLDWLQLNGTKVYKLEVQRVDGDWRDAATDGSITYYLAGKIAGKAIFSRTSGAAKIELYLDGSTPASYSFQVQSVTKNSTH